MKKILIPVDFSEYTEKIIEEGKKMAQAFNSDIVLLYIVNENIGEYHCNTESKKESLLEPFLEHERKQAEEDMKKWGASLSGVNGEVETVVLSGSVTDEILKYINETDIDFVLMGSHGMGSTFYRTLVGSIANSVIHHSEKPVLLIKC